jgi:hypothetical protein
VKQRERPNKEIIKKDINIIQKCHLIKVAFFYFCQKNSMYKILAKINKVFLPSFTKQRLDLAKAKKWQLAIIGYRYFVTKKALDS